MTRIERLKDISKLDSDGHGLSSQQIRRVFDELPALLSLVENMKKTLFQIGCAKYLDNSNMSIEAASRLALDSLTDLREWNEND